MAQPSKRYVGHVVLVVEDDFLCAEDIALSLEALGAVVIGPASSVSRALDLIARSERLDAAVLDVHLGRQTSLPVAEALRERHVPFVLATGQDTSSLPDTLRGERCFQKPINSEQLAEVLLA